MGQILTAGQGQNPARQARWPPAARRKATAWNLNQVCGSGLRAVALGAAHHAGDADIIVAGGQENMSMSPHAAHLRRARRWAT
jgi:acetyl-CoA C-acetyltransferase